MIRSKLFLSAALSLLAAAALLSCKKESLTADELAARNYPSKVYIQGSNFSTPGQPVRMDHNVIDGVIPATTEQVLVRLTRASDSDVKVRLALSVDKEQLKDKLSLSTQEVTIKAGELIAAPVTINISDIEYFKGVKEALNYAVTVTATLADAPASVSLSKDYTSYTFNFSKAQEVSNFLTERALTPNHILLDKTYGAGVPQDNRASMWKVVEIGPAGYTGTPSELYDNGTRTSISTTGGAKPYVVLDLGRSVSLAGIEVRFPDRTAIPQEHKVSISEDGQHWHTLGTIKLSNPMSRLADINFSRVFTVRYVRYEVSETAASGNTVMSEIDFLLADL